MPERVIKYKETKAYNTAGHDRVIEFSQVEKVSEYNLKEPLLTESLDDTRRRQEAKYLFEVYTVQEVESRINYVAQLSEDHINAAKASASNDLTREIMATKNYSDAQANKFLVERTIPKIRELLHEMIVGLDGMGEGEAGNAFAALIEKIVEAKIKERLNGVADEAPKE
ncbi:hypothetical protein [Planctopirus hydrillae]|uniref:Uncharacterized protein n=1 Tax=Planctopirus hydrillae TaxID=1841610 RepID=A0A1C3E4N4_9PLAN|nr:hypothetical protein [Planctopirus hydrillae]ODA28190.1 hypothetical protein A6X21_13535 [Planctopirus hydrillae]